MKNLLKIILALSIMTIGMYGIGCFIFQVIKMCLEVGD